MATFFNAQWHVPMVHTDGTLAVMRAVVKITGTMGIVVLLSYPLWAPQWGQGILGEVAALPMPAGIVVVAAFFGLVALYCRTLQRTLMVVREDARAAPPASVWWMFAIPYNFIEDFFIVRTVAASLSLDAHLPALWRNVWSALGYGWCGLQILSLFPGAAGYIGGAVAVVLWAVHWMMTIRINRILAAHPTTAALAATR
jgi:hypothetical protein